MDGTRCPTCGGSGTSWDINDKQTCTYCGGSGDIPDLDPRPAPVRNRRPQKAPDAGRPSAQPKKQKGLLETLFGNNPPAKKPAKKVSKPKKAASKEPPVKRDFWEGIDEKPPQAVIDGIMVLSAVGGFVAAMLTESQTGSSGLALVAGAAGLAGSMLVLTLGYYALKMALVLFKVAVIVAFFAGALYLLSEIS